MELHVDFGERKLFQLKKRRIKMRIAICDDDVQLICLLKQLIYRYANEHRYDFVVEEFYSGESLLNSSLVFDIIFLDYKMNILNGLDTAKQLRKRNTSNVIVFVTSYTHFVLDAFKVNAFRFLVKPITEKKIWETLDDYFSMYGNDYPVLLKSERETLCIDTKEIVFLEADNKHCIIHLADLKSIHCTKTMATVGKLMPRNHFYKVNRAFIINFNYIVKYNSDEIMFTNGEHVHISRNYLTAFNLPLFSIKGIRIIEGLYVSLFYIGYTSALVMPLAWILSSFAVNHAFIMAISAIFNIALTALCLYLSKKEILKEILKHTNLVSKRIKVIILFSIWLCAFLVFLMAELFYEFPKTGPLILIQVLVALVVSIIGISEPLLIINNITGTYYKSVSNSIRKQMEQQVKYYERLYQADEELRRFRHDYKNLRIGLISQLKSNNVAAALQYLENSERPYTRDYITFETGNPIADALLFDGFIPNGLIDPCDICIILGNALDNAIEACSAIDRPVEKQICIQSHFNNNFLFLTVSNPSIPVAIHSNRVRTTKKDKVSHGMGLYAIENSAKRHSGDVKLSWKDDVFRLEISLDFNMASTKESA